MFKKIIFPSLPYIVLLNLILKIGLYCYIAPWNKHNEEKRILVVNDSKGYERLAVNLLEYHTYAPDTTNTKLIYYENGTSKGLGNIAAKRLPGYSTFLAMIYWVAGIKPFIAIFIQILLSLISVVMVYRISILLFDNKNIASVASLLFSLDIHSIYESNRLLSDILFSVFIIISAYYFIRSYKKGWLKDIIVSAIFMGIACLTRPVGLLYPLVLIGLLFLFGKRDINYKIKSGIIYVCIVYFFTGIWCFRNHCEYDTWQFTTQSGKQLLMVNVAQTKANYTNEPIKLVMREFQQQCDSMGFQAEKNPFKQSDIYLKVGLNYFRQHKICYIYTQIKGGITMFLLIGTKHISTTLGWSSDDWFRRILLNILIVSILLLEYIGCLYGIRCLIISRNYMALVLFLLTTFYFIIFTGAVGTIFERYKLPVVPFICIVAGYGYYHIIETNSKKDKVIAKD